MYLKSIEIHGFKSFANRIVFQFHNGITGIVGPNGSGKSNVADAVRWVLGEQSSRQLRGSSMQDVIFSGTETRKPMGYAYVAITLDNSDHKLDTAYDEVTVARRLYRSGESEYLINGTAVRLRDVSELFYDTGIGKEGYSIIGQGQIDKILSDKPEERRELFDEAAGIVKFKRRKETTERKLASEQENLVRVSDILSELEKQVGPMKKQSEKAQVYLKAREEQKHLDVNAFLLENGKNTQKLSEIENRLTIANGDLAAAKEEFEKTGREYESLGDEIDALEKKLEETRNEITRTSVVREQLEGQVRVNEEKIRSAKGSMEHFYTRRDSLKADIERVSAEKEKISEEHAKTGENLEKLTLARKEAAEKLEEAHRRVTAAETAAEESKSTILRLLDERANIKSRLASITTKEEQLDIRKAELTSKLVLAQTNREKQSEVIEEAEKLFERVSTEVRSLQKKRTDIEEELNGIKPQLAANDQTLRESEIREKQLESRLETLQNLTERYEGFGNSVRRVMQEKGRESGLVGVVADLFKTEPKYETAIETALGGNIQNIVTKTPDTAKAMIELLKREKAGRATFLPLTSLTHPQEFKDMQYLREPGVIGLADSLVQCDAAYENAAKTLLGRIVVVDGFDHARELARKSGQRLRIVTLEGELFAPGGSISGGAFRSQSNLLGRRREIGELKVQIEKARQDAAAAERTIEDLKKHRNELREADVKVGEEVQKKLIEQNTARLSVTQEREKAEQSAGDYEELKAENEDIGRQKEELGNERKEANDKLTESVEAEKSEQEKADRLSQEAETLRKEENESTAAVNDADAETGKVRQSFDFEQQNLDRIQGDYDRYQADLKEILESIESADKEIAERQDDIEKIRGTIEASENVQGKSKEEMEEASNRRSELSDKRKELFSRREQLNEQINSLDKESYRLGQQKEKLQDSMDAQVSYLWDEYEVTPSDAAAMRDDTLSDLPAMKKQIAELKNQIRALGPVNVNAIEDYKNLMERYTFLKGQHDDLVAAAENLKKIIADLDESMRKQFREQFAKIRTEFDKVFQEMFGGGHGTLELVEDEDILEAGIRVIAQPPGKKLTNMMQMSGGEKALTAISLLFAIQNLKPSPFCILDEIEAALDESNVGRFADYLHKLTEHTQFIVITHRRGTMERADRLYGITMQEKGVSTLVSVSLIDKDLSN